MKYSLFLLLGLLLPLALLAAPPPNMVFILGDDQGWSDYGFMGHEEIRTPHLDRLAARSLVFPRGYVAAPLCRPSLASMATGLFPHQHGVTGNDVRGREDRAALDVAVQTGFHQHPSFIKLLTENGYLAHQSGKWWEGSYADGGFTHGMTHGDPKRHGRHGDAGLSIGRKGLEPIATFVDHARAEQKPFLLWYAPFLPHTPHNPPERLLKKYTREGRAMDEAKYYAMCEWFDETCGALLALLDERGLTDNTLVLSTCDNGWAARSTNADDPDQEQWKGFALRSKGSPFELGIRNPVMVSWPGRVVPERSDDLAHAVDLFPTIAAATGLQAPTGLPGINLMDAEARAARDTVYGVTHAIHNMTVGDPDDTLQYQWCVNGKWKLLVRYHGEDTTAYRRVHCWDTVPVRLYDLESDPHEQHNLAEQHPEVVARLRTQLDAWHTPVVKGSTP